MTPWTLTGIEDALRASWAADTCSPDDAARAGWTGENPGWGHGDITALLLNDVFGGDLMVADVHHRGERLGYHWWNRLPTGIEIDLARDQFRDGQTIGAGRVARRQTTRPVHRWREYQVLSGRVLSRL
ncbi:hypothetical protein AQ490_07310 [Wenjunlia vitaminophila]|uniref:Uncharacterized protein n=1 Tax=Wenjunlia vitaminophila TaxID=76728 RepID=A0A0T6LMT1_WENVI|nr:hypothetical protein [Wenjunlia vitaminophila]KRV47443.1 hypothetical protein AQ490_07310 [Wenjunlia vitaminophila]